MKSLSPLVLGIALVGSIGSVACAEEPSPGADEKQVRLVWFPRFSPDGKWLATAHGSWEEKEGGEARVWNATSGEMVYAFKHPRGVRSVAWLPTGKVLATGGYDHGLRFFDVESGKQLHEERLGASIEGVAISRDGRLLVTTHGTGDVRVRELPELVPGMEIDRWAAALTPRREIHHFQPAHQGGIWGMTLSADGKLLATAGKDAHVRVFDMTNFTILHDLEHPGETNGVAFSEDGRRLLTGCADSLVRVFDLKSGEETAALRGHEGGGISDVQFSSDGKLLATAGFDGTVRLWDVSDLDEPVLRETLRQHDSLVFGVAISPDNKLVASAGWDDKIVVWDLKNGQERWAWKR